jgi:hypothetical protein
MPWYKKKDMGVFCGQLTGSREGYDKNLSDKQNCINMKRCRLVYNHSNSAGGLMIVEVIVFMGVPNPWSVKLVKYK